MGIKLDNISNLFSDVKTRTIIIFTGAILIGGLIIGLLGLFRDTGPTAGTARTVKAPPIKSIPGVAPASEIYAKAQQTENIQRAKAAAKGGTSSIPTLIGQEPPKQGQGAVPSSPPAGTAGSSTIGPVDQFSGQQGLGPAGAAPAGTAGQLQVKEDLQKAMSSQAKTLFASWAAAPKQVQVVGDSKANGNNSGSPDASGVANEPSIAVKAGDIVFAVLNTGINTDEPAPILATIVSGRLKGGKLVGSVQRVEKRVVVTFNRLNMPRSVSSVGISAVAIDPNTARTALADKVNSHYLLRYGSLFASSFLEGYGRAVETEGTIQTNTENGTTTTQNQQRSTRNRVSIAIGEVGKKLSKNLNVFNKPPTVIVNSGTGVGILFTGDIQVKVPGLTGDVILSAERAKKFQS